MVPDVSPVVELFTKSLKACATGRYARAAHYLELGAATARELCGDDSLLLPSLGQQRARALAAQATLPGNTETDTAALLLESWATCGDAREVLQTRLAAGTLAVGRCRREEEVWERQRVEAQLRNREGSVRCVAACPQRGGPRVAAGPHCWTPNVH